MEFMSGYQDRLITFSRAMADWHEHYEAAQHIVKQNKERVCAARLPLDSACTYWILHLLESTAPPSTASSRLKQAGIDPSELRNADGQNMLFLTDSSGLLLGFDVLPQGLDNLSDGEKAAGGDWESVMTPMQRILGLLHYSMLTPMSGGISRRPRFLRIIDKRLHRLLSCRKSFFSALKVALWPEATGGWVPVDVDPETGTPCPQAFSMRWPPTFFCHACKKHSSLSQLKPCPGCKAVLFCSEDCPPSTSQSMLDFSRHHCCEKLSFCMSRNAQLADLPFTYATETTAVDFDVEHFLVKNNLDTGYWQYWSLLIQSPRYELIYEKEKTRRNWVAGHLEPYGSLKKEANILLSFKLHNSPGFKVPLVSWSQYFSRRGLSLASPVAVLLSSTLSIYYIITSLVPQDFPELNILKKQSLKIHIIESDREFQTLMTFSELAVLLPQMTFELLFIGEKIPQECDEQQFFLQKKSGSVMLTNLTLGSEEIADKKSIRIKAYKRTYHMFQGPKPDLVIGFRPAFFLNDSWLSILPRLQSLRVPAYFCEPSQLSCESNQQVMSSATGGALSAPVINPFRCPLRTCGGDNLLPWYCNAFIFHLNYKPLVPCPQRPTVTNGQAAGQPDLWQQANQRTAAAQQVAPLAQVRMTRKERKWAAHNASHKRK